MLSSTSVFAQLFQTGYPAMALSSDVKTISLANANVAASGVLGDYHINPAGIGTDKTFELTPRYQNYGIDAFLLSIDFNLKRGNSAISFSFKGNDNGAMYAMEYPQPQFVNWPGGSDAIFNTTYAYSFSNGLRLGAGINYYSLSYFSDSVLLFDNKNYYKGYTLDLGILYEKQIFEDSELSLDSGLGLSITDFGDSPGKVLNRYEFPVPTTLRLGGKVGLETIDKIYDLKIVQLDLMVGLSKIMVRTERAGNAENGFQLKTMPPFEALFKSWGTLKYFNRRDEKKAKTLQQIWVQSAVQMMFLETFSMRFGVENAAKAENFLDKITIGFGIDIYYLSIDYAWLYYSNGYSADVYSPEVGHHIQVTGRIPFDGYKPNSLLNKLFN